MWPVREPGAHLADFFKYPMSPLSVKACDGFLSRAARSTLRFPDGLLAAIEAHRNRLAGGSALEAS